MQILYGGMESEAFPITGFTENRDTSIYGDDYVFTFMQNREMDGTTYSIVPEDEFIRGISHAGSQLAIHCSETMESQGYHRLSTFCYMRSEGIPEHKVTTFNEIVFKGGTLNYLFMPRGLSWKHKKKNDRLKVKSDGIEYTVSIGATTCKIKVESCVEWSAGVAGSHIKNNEIRLAMRFSEPQPLSSAIRCYDSLCGCMRFMQNRDNVGVDEIKLYTLTADYPIPRDMFKVFIKKEQAFSTKGVTNNITFDELGQSFSKLMALFCLSSNDNMQYSLGFYPDDDKHEAIMNNDLIRSICAALEFEASQESEVTAQENALMEELVAGTKKYIKKFRKDNPGISESTYSRIFGGISFWSFSARDKIEQLYKIHGEAMSVLRASSIGDAEIDIGKFIAYRNQITHGAAHDIPVLVATTAYILKGLVYCCVLKRIGISEDKIILLCADKINN